MKQTEGPYLCEIEIPRLNGIVKHKTIARRVSKNDRQRSNPELKVVTYTK